MLCFFFLPGSVRASLPSFQTIKCQAVGALSWNLVQRSPAELSLFMACISMMALLWPLKEVHLSLIPYRGICKAHLLEISWRLWPRRRYWTEGNAKWEIQLWKHAVTTSLASGKTQVKFLSLFIPYALTEIRCCAALAWLGKVTTMIRLQRLKTQLWQKHGPSRVPKEIIFFSNETGKYGEMTTNIDHW